MTAVDIWNLALIRIGVTNTIAATTDATREAFTGALVFDHYLRLALRAFPWGFATKYATLVQTQGPEDTDSTIQVWSATQTYAVGDVVTDSGVTYYCLATSLNNEPPNVTYWTTTATLVANGDWRYAYRWPSDCLFARRIVPYQANGTGRRFNPTPPTFRVGRDVNGLLIYSQQPDAVLEYTVIDCANLWADDLFIEALAWLLAAAAAPGLSRIDNIEQRCLVMYQATMDQAAAVSSREQQQEKPGLAEWHIARQGIVD